MHPPTPPAVIKTHFDTTLTVGEDKIHAIMGSLKVKNRFETKEKEKKQLAAISEFRSALKTALDEIKVLREKCVASEAAAHGMIHDSHLEMDELTQINTDITSNERKLQKEVEALRAERDLLSRNLGSETDVKSKKLASLEAETIALKCRVAEQDSQISKLSDRLATEDGARANYESEVARLKEEVSTARQEVVEANANAHSKYEQKAEATVNTFKEEIATLKAEAGGAAGEAKRMREEMVEMERRCADVRQQQLHAEAALKDATMNADRCASEIARLTSDIASARDQIAQKDALIATTLTSVGEIQREGTVEKGKLREECRELQCRVQALEQERLENTAQLAAKKEEVLALGRELCTMKETVAALQAKIAAQELELGSGKEAAVQLEVERELRAKCEVREEDERRERMAACGQLFAIQRECDSRMKELEMEMARSVDAAKQELAAATTAREAAEIEAGTHRESIAGLQSEIESLKQSLANASANSEVAEQLSKATGEVEILRRRIKELGDAKAAEGSCNAAKVEALEEQIRQHEVVRRQLHNKIQELRGNVRVFARVRPFLPSDGIDLSNAEQLPEPTTVTKPDGSSLKIKHTAAATPQNSSSSSEYRTVESEHSFSFDKVFGPSSGQETVFQEVSEFVQSALDGYNVCLFSYGQTGSGKTHTMQGSGNGSMRGIIPRAMEQVGQYKAALEKKGWAYTMEVSFIEIYNETIRDLLRTSARDDVKHEIKKDMQGNATITDVSLLTIDPSNAEAVEGVMELAARHRSIGQTNMNEQSSRSHSVFTLYLKASNADQGISLKGTLSLVDLAGSERLDRSGATGARMKETVAINKSLSALTDVFVAIGNKQPHIPFRNSKLTYLLQSALSGDGKTLMMVNLSPTEESFFESYCSLKFAEKVNACELGKPKRQIKDYAPVAAAAASSSSAGCPMEEEEGEQDTVPESTPAPKTSSKIMRSATAPASTPSKTVSSKKPRVAGAGTAASGSRLRK